MRAVSSRQVTQLTRAAAAIASIGLALSFALATASPATATTLVNKTVKFTTSDVTAGFTTWKVPSGVTSLTISALGANGAPSPSIADGGMATLGGLGAIVHVKVTVVPGSVLTIAVGSVNEPGAAGLPGGGGSLLGDESVGGGWSGVQLPDTTPLVVAGAGGGGGDANGGDAGSPGGTYPTGGGGGGAGTQTAGGAGGTAGDGGLVGGDGGPYQGGEGVGGDGAGGGGGYYGGGGGGQYFFGGGGGGGSSFPDVGDPTLLSSTIKSASARANGSLSITYLGAADPTLPTTGLDVQPAGIAVPLGLVVLGVMLLLIGRPRARRA
ncbi:MAG TPA: hypothetical protein VHX87_05980 [Galbitalea sp.]|jgi:hypothetical protein|nr:hypothetical protein [Galbitalea sp.]